MIHKTWKHELQKNKKIKLNFKRLYLMKFLTRSKLKKNHQREKKNQYGHVSGIIRYVLNDSSRIKLFPRDSHN